MKLLHVIKNTLLILLITVFGIVLLPLIIVGVLYVGSWAFYEWIFKKIRRDPNTKLEKLAVVPHDEVREYNVDWAKGYFEKLVNAIAEKSGRSTPKYAEKVVPSGIQDIGGETIVLTKRITAKRAKANFVLEIERTTADTANATHFSAYEEDDTELAGNIRTQVVVDSLSDDAIEFLIRYDQIGAYFCVGLLSGKGAYNSRTKQSGYMMKPMVCG